MTIFTSNKSNKDADFDLNCKQISYEHVLLSSSIERKSK